MSQTRSYGCSAVLFAAAALCGACAGSPPQSLVDARAAYARAAKGQAKDLAPAQLHAARTVLNLAEKTYEDEGESANARDRAYVAQRKAELAEVQAQIASANAQLAQIERRGELAEEQQQAATAQELAQTRAQLEDQRDALEEQQEALEGESERRAQAE